MTEQTDETRTPHQGPLTQGQHDTAVADATEVMYTQEELDAAFEKARQDMFTQEEFDEAFAEATEGLFTQADVDAAVEKAEEEMFTQQEVDAAIAEAREGLYTQEQLDEAVDNSRDQLTEHLCSIKKEFNMDNTANSKPVQLSEEEARIRLNAYVSEHGWPAELANEKDLDQAGTWRYQGGKLSRTIVREYLLDNPSDKQTLTDCVRHTISYVFDPNKGSFEKRHNDDHSIEVPDMYGWRSGLSVDYTITVEKLGEMKYSVKLPIFGKQWEASSLKEAQVIARAIFPEIDFESLALESHEKGEDDTTLVEASVEVLLDKLKEAWDEAVGTAA